MSVDAHLTELVRRHHALEKEIENETIHSGYDDLKVAELKRKKLVIKDKIERLKQASQLATVH